MHELQWCEILLFPVKNALTIEIIHEYLQFKKMVTQSSNNFLDSCFCVQSLYYKIWERQIVWNYLLGWNSWFWSQQKTCPCQFWEFVYALHLLVSSCCWQNSNGHKFFKLVDGRQNGPRENDSWFYEFKKKGVSISYFCIYCKIQLLNQSILSPSL